MYKLTIEQELRFEEMYENYKDKIKLVMYKCNISPNNYAHFYSHALEGFLQAFLILDTGDISERDFPAFAFINMKRKVIDEMRRFSRNKELIIDIKEYGLNMAYREDDIDKFIVHDSLKNILSKQEIKIFSMLEKGVSYKEIIKTENISKTQYYNILSDIRHKYYDLLYK